MGNGKPSAALGPECKVHAEVLCATCMSIRGPCDPIALAAARAARHKHRSLADAGSDLCFKLVDNLIDNESEHVGADR